MSPEADPANSASEPATPTPAKNDKSSTARAKKGPEVSRAQYELVLKRIPPAVKDHPLVYERVVHHIKSTSMSRKWVDTGLCRRFFGWCDFSDDRERPKLEIMIATLVVYDWYDVRNSRFDKEVTNRGLRAWVAEQLNVNSQAASAPETTAPATPQQVPQVKTEPGLRDDHGADSIRQSIEDENGSAATSGLKRPALEHPAGPINKRANLWMDHAPVASELDKLAVFQPSPQRIVYRETGTQTDNNAAIEEISRPMCKVTAAMEEQTQVLKNHNGMLAHLLERAQGTQLRPSTAVAHPQPFQVQAQAQEMVPVHHVNRPLPALYFEHGQDSGNSGPFLRFGRY